MIAFLKSLYHFLFHFNPAQDIEWDGRRYKDEDITEELYNQQKQSLDMSSKILFQDKDFTH